MNSYVMCLFTASRFTPLTLIVVMAAMVLSPLTANNARAQTCSSDADCPGGNCIGTECDYQCDIHPDPCPGQICQNAAGDVNGHYCVDCLQDSDCPSGQYCDLQNTPTCKSGCQSDADCTSPKTCDLTTNTCVPEMSDYLAMVFLASGGGMIFYIRRRAMLRSV